MQKVKKNLRVALSDYDGENIKQLMYAIYFVDGDIIDISYQNSEVIITHSSEREDNDLLKDIDILVNRFSNSSLDLKLDVIFENKVNTLFNENIIDIMQKNNLLVPIDLGIFAFKEPLSLLLRFIDYYIVKKYSEHFDIKSEYYPAVIKGNTLDKTNHFSSLPAHVHFIHKNVDGLPNEIEYVMNPATCYHCYEAMSQTELFGTGTVITAVSKANRYESKNHNEFGRLLDFTMREVICIGKPAFVTKSVEKTLDVLKDIVSRWEIDCTIESANDFFVSDDFQSKASFQRSHGMKYELRLNIPYLSKSIAGASSNFNGNLFGKAFDIKQGNKYVVSSCIGFGLERWVLAFVAQYGICADKWPKAFVEDFEQWKILRRNLISDIRDYMQESE